MQTTTTSPNPADAKPATVQPEDEAASGLLLNADVEHVVSFDWDEKFDHEDGSMYKDQHGTFYTSEDDDETPLTPLSLIGALEWCASGLLNSSGSQGDPGQVSLAAVRQLKIFGMR